MREQQPQLVRLWNKCVKLLSTLEWDNLVNTHFSHSRQLV